MKTRKEFCELAPKEAKLIGRDIQLREIGIVLKMK
jgi:hypothetical protein